MLVQRRLGPRGSWGRSGWCGVCLAVLLGLLVHACGDEVAVPYVCDEQLCQDCSDPCCYEVGYC